jgi:hypothetical protein
MWNPRRAAKRCLVLAIPAGRAFEELNYPPQCAPSLKAGLSRRPWSIAGWSMAGLARNKMVNGAIKSHHAMLFAVQLALTLALFSLDIVLGPGIADGIGYSIVMVLCLRNPKRGYALAWAGITTLLVIVGGTISPDSGVLYAAAINRALEICTIWVVWFLLRAIVPKVSN